MMFVKILGCIAAIAATLPLSADLIPTYNYFYSCDSGLVDCASFSRHYYGDFGMTGPQPQFGEFATSRVVSSNQSGEVLGHLFNFGGYQPFYGSVGEIFRLTTFATDMAEALDINNNGVYLIHGVGADFKQWFAYYIGVGRSASGLWKHISPQVASSLGVDGLCDPLASEGFGCGYYFDTWFSLQRSTLINDYDQILTTISIKDANGYRTVDGVLSPHAVPEPYPVVLFGIVNGLALLIRSRRKPYA